MSQAYNEVEVEDSPESNAKSAIREAIRVRNLVLSSLDTCALDRFPSGQMLFLYICHKVEGL